MMQRIAIIFIMLQRMPIISIIMQRMPIDSIMMQRIPGHHKRAAAEAATRHTFIADSMESKRPLQRGTRCRSTCCTARCPDNDGGRTPPNLHKRMTSRNNHCTTIAQCGHQTVGTLPTPLARASNQNPKHRLFSISRQLDKAATHVAVVQQCCKAAKWSRTDVGHSQHLFTRLTFQALLHDLHSAFMPAIACASATPIR